MNFTTADLDFLDQSVIPVRLSVLTREGNPALASLWFQATETALWCAVQEDSFFARCLRHDPRCAFEVAGDQPPYKGLRGPAQGEVIESAGGSTLNTLLERYLGSRDAELRAWLLSRSDSEVALKISPTRLTRWDFSPRMEAPG